MQSDCIREASKACFNTCCVKPLLGLPPPPSPPPAAAADPRRNFVSAVLTSLQPHTNFTNHESLPSSTELFSSLTNAVPNYLSTVLADRIRDQEYYHLSLSNHVCLDYVGHGLFSYSQKQGRIPATEAATSSSSSAEAPLFEISYTSVTLNSYLLYGNHESELQSLMRRRIMRYMNVFEEDYSLVFTANQSSAFKILGDSYPFHSNQNLLTVYDYENDAVELMVESARKQSARCQSAIFSWPNFRINSRKLRKIIVNKNLKNRGLFAFPLQSRMTGSRYSYQWMTLARENGWHVLLDASALGAKEMETLGLSLFQPDFIICSFFKIFGENPSGFSCLFVKKSSVPDLNQSSKSIGIVAINPENVEKSDSGEFEETQSLCEIVQLSESTQLRGLDHADELGLVLLSSRARYLVNWLVNAMLSLRHPHSGNGLPLVMIYGPRIKVDRGPALAFNVYDWKGEMVDPVLVQKLADRNNISVTIGFLKNIWFSENLQEKERVIARKSKEECGVKVVSVSLGMVSNFEDMYRVWGFVSKFLDADFVEKERWRYTALNQTTVEV